MAAGIYVKTGGVLTAVATGIGPTGPAGPIGSSADQLAITALGNKTGALDLTAYTAAGRLFTLTATGNLTIAPAGMPTTVAGMGASFLTKITQDGTGSRTLTLDVAIKTSYGVDPVLSTTASAIDMLTFLWDGTTWNALLSGQAMA